MGKKFLMTNVIMNIEKYDLTYTHTHKHTEQPTMRK